MSPEFKLTRVQQQAACETLNRNIALSAGAGCGKTFVLAKRFTNLLVESKNEDALERIVALTFTEKAALEMSQRVSKMLAQLIEKTTDLDEKMKLRNWSENSDQFRISTIHSFCSSLLRSYAIEIGLDPEFQVCADQFYTDALLNDAIKKTIVENLNSENDTATELLLNIKFETLVNIVRELIYYRDRIDFSDYLNCDALLDRWSIKLKEIRAQILEDIRNDTEIVFSAKQLSETLNASQSSEDKRFITCNVLVDLVLHIQTDNAPDYEWVFDQLKQVSFRGGSKKNWGSSDDFQLAKDLGTQIKNGLKKYSLLLEDLNQGDERAAKTLAKLCEIAQASDAKYTELKNHDNILDFTDLINYTAAMLQENPSLACKISEGIDQLLIDEGQDTDRVQIEFLKSIISAEDGRLTDGKVFIVGDTKQSIYRFRGAELECYDGFQNEIGEENNLDLNDTFRTHQAGVGFVNHLFSKLIKGFTRTSSLRSIENVDDTVEIILASGQFDKKNNDQVDSITGAQAAVTADRIEQLINGDEKTVWDNSIEDFRRAKAGDIAILFSRMTESLAYEKELQRRNIPYYVVAGTGFFKQQEVFDILNFLRIIENPTDDISFVGVLRSAMFGITDDTLLHIAQTVSKPYLPELTIAENLDKISRKIQPAQVKILKRAADFIFSNHKKKNSYKVAELIEQILEFTSYDAFLLSRDQGKRMLGNVRQLIVFATSSVGELSLAEFINNMDDLTVKETRYEQAASVAEHENVVRLMTIHKSKGLEFPVVIVPDLNQTMRTITAPVLYRNDIGLSTKLAFVENENIEPLYWQYSKYFEKLDERAEMIRKYYVALTRHEDRLILIGADKRDKAGLFPKDSFLALLDKHLKLPVDDNTVIKYGLEKQYQLTAKIVEPNYAKQTQSRSKSIGRQILSKAKSPEDVSRSLMSLASSNELPEFLGQVTIDPKKFRIAPTVLTTFKQCPMLYYWKYELRAPIDLPDLNTDTFESKSQLTNVSKSPFNALMLGTFLHKCFELYNFSAPQSADKLVRLASEELEYLSTVQYEFACDLLQDIIEKFNRTKLAADLKRANQIYREVDFTTTQEWGDLSGQIDLLYEIDGCWHVVDYKSDRATEDVQKKVSQYQTQLAVYADAVKKVTGQLPASTSLYFMRTGKTASAELTSSQIESIFLELNDDVKKLKLAQISGNYQRCNRENCDFCSNKTYANISTNT